MSLETDQRAQAQGLMERPHPIRGGQHVIMISRSMIDGEIKVYLAYSLRSRYMAKQAMESPVMGAISLLLSTALLHRAKPQLNLRILRHRCLSVPIRARTTTPALKPRTLSVNGATLRRGETETPAYLPRLQEVPTVKRYFLARMENKKCLTQASGTSLPLMIITDLSRSIQKTEERLTILQSWHHFSDALDRAITKY